MAVHVHSKHWRERLEEGIADLEGTAPSGLRILHRAATIFEECAGQSEEPEVRTAAHFRRAHVALCEGQTAIARRWIDKGNKTLFDLTSPETQAQCRLVEGMVLEDEQKTDKAALLYGELWKIRLKDKKLRADIASQMAQVVGGIGRGDSFIVACQWIQLAESCLLSIPEPDNGVYHALAAVQTRAAYLFQQRSWQLTEEAGELFRQGKVRDSWLRGNYWCMLSKMAWLSCHPLKAFWFFLRFLAA